MIRLLQSNEVEKMIEGGRLFFEEGRLPGGFKPEVFTANWCRFIDSGVGAVIAMFGPDGAIQGALGGIFYDDPFNGDPVSTEQFWYVLPQYRGRGVALLSHYMAFAQARGCKRVSMIHLEALQPEALKALYERKGFRLIETGYIHEFERN